jgi:hypothetical protein
MGLILFFFAIAWLLPLVALQGILLTLAIVDMLFKATFWVIDKVLLALIYAISFITKDKASAPITFD